ncbi:unnamed protein product, partial [Symbiodinium microadriaticum]
LPPSLLRSLHRHWIKGTDLPPLSAGTRPISDEKKRRLGGKCTLILRGFTNKPEYGDRTPNIRLRAGDLSADWEEFLSALGQIWRGLRVSDIMQMFQQPPDGKARYEVFAKVTSEHEIEILRVRCMQGHSGEMLSDHVDILETHAAVHTFVDWDPEWLRQDNSGLRANAEIEFVIDLQLAVLDGLRLLETRAGALETPDWISNKYLVYAYKRGSAEPIWANPAYPAFRLRVDKALDAWDKDGATPYILDPDEDMYNRYDCFLDLLDDALSDYIGEWAPVAADSKVPYFLHTDRLTGIKGGYQIRKNPATDDYAEASEGEFGRSLCVWVSKAHNFAKAGLSFFIIEALQRFANVRLPNPRGKGKGKGSATLYDATGKLAFVWVSGQSEIDLLTECLVCFHDRFYTIDEIAVLIKAVKSNQQEFSILLFNGEKHHMVQNEILAIMSELANVFARELPQSRTPDERGYPEIILSRELAVPPGATELGHRQLNQLLANTPYFQKQPQYFMDRRIGQSTVFANVLQLRRPLKSAGHQCRRLPQLDVVAALTSVPAQGQARRGPGLVPRSGETAPLRRISAPVEPPCQTTATRQRLPLDHISDADWAAMRSGRPFTAPETDASAANDTGSVASEISSVIDLTRPAQWAERYRRRPNDPVTFGYFSDTVRISDRERRSRQTVVDFFEQLETAGFLYSNFRLGYDEFGNMIDPNYARRLGWNRVDQYQWAVFACMTEEVYIPEHVINMIPSHDNPHGFTSLDTSHVQWFLQGWRHEVYNHRTGRRDRLY